MTRKVFITGTAGFIGFHLAKLLLDEGNAVCGYDGMTDYYDVRLKQRRHEMLSEHARFSATEAMLEWAGTMSAEDILGDIDALKFRSSMTLFEAACDDEDSQVFADALEAFFDGERCPLTVDRM